MPFPGKIVQQPEFGFRVHKDAGKQSVKPQLFRRLMNKIEIAIIPLPNSFPKTIQTCSNFSRCNGEGTLGNQHFLIPFQDWLSCLDSDVVFLNVSYCGRFASCSNSVLAGRASDCRICLLGIGGLVQTTHLRNLFLRVAIVSISARFKATLNLVGLLDWGRDWRLDKPNRLKMTSLVETVDCIRQA